jgi:hypothetical protein
MADVPMADPDPGSARHGSWRRYLPFAVLVAVAAVVAVVLASRPGAGSSSSSPSQSVPAVTSPRTPTVSTTTSPAASAPTGPGPPATPPPARQEFGVNVNRLFNDRTYTPRQIDRQLRALKATGATVARSDALWEATEPAAPVDGIHRYDWSFDDSIAAALARHGLRWLPIIDYSAPWAQSVTGVDHSPPSSPANYAAYAGALASRYGAGGSFWREHPGLPAEPVSTWEIWNEPDNPTFWSPEPEVARYAALYEGARDAILGFEPTAAVIVGGLTDPVAFIPALLTVAPDLRGHIDGIGLHPYGTDPSGVLSNVTKAKQVLTAAGIGDVPLYITELGWTTHPPSNPSYLPESKRPAYLEQTLAGLGRVRCGLAATIVYTWVTPERNRADGQDWFGIHGPDGAGTPDSAAFAAGIRSVSGSASRQCPSGGSARAPTPPVGTL